jgi:glycosyltransferase involved in cell wall biosynthesis
VGTGAEEARLHDLAGKKTLFTGFAPDDDLPALYAGARGFVAAAEDEDFGMTVVEAQSYGVPVIALRKGGYLESVVENTTGVFFDTLSTESLRSAVDVFQTHEFQARDCIVQAAKFSTGAFVGALRQVITEKVTN